MRYLCSLALLTMACVSAALAVPRQHTVVLGHSRTVNAPDQNGRTQSIKVRELLVDGRLREYTSGAPHEVTDRLFVIRRARRINDSLPSENGQRARWIWQLEGWISVDRTTGHVAQLNLPGFDPEISEANWYRDYAAYCGSSDDGSKTYMMVFQIGKRKPILKREFAGAGECPAPVWERNPSRVTFNAGGEKSSFAVRAHGAAPQAESNSEDEGPQ
jgi:hypothetical protein